MVGRLEPLDGDGEVIVKGQLVILAVGTMGERLRGGERGKEVLGGDLRGEGDRALDDRGRALGVEDGDTDGVEEGERKEEAGERAEEDAERDAAEARGGADLRAGNPGLRLRRRG